MSGIRMNVSVTNLTNEELQLDAISVKGCSCAPQRIEPHSVRSFRSDLNSEGSVSYLIGGDPDRGIYIHFDAASSGGVRDEHFDVWASPVYAVRSTEHHDRCALDVSVSSAAHHP